MDEKGDQLVQYLVESVKGINDKLDNLSQQVTTRLHEGDIKFVQIETQVAQHEEYIKRSDSSKMRAHRRVSDAIFDLVKAGVKYAVIAAGSIILWALTNGYKIH